MAYRFPWSTRCTAFAAYGLLRLWLGSLDCRVVFESDESDPDSRETPALYALWHEGLLVPSYTHPRSVIPLISRSADGELITQIMRYSGGDAIQGSTDRKKRSHGGREAVWKLLRAGRQRSLAITVDGPVGPARVASRGNVVIAAKLGMPVIPAGIGISRYVEIGPKGRRIRFPWPFARAWVLLGRPLTIGRSDLEGQRQKVQDALDAIQARADALAAHRDARVPGSRRPTR